MKMIRYTFKIEEYCLANKCLQAEEHNCVIFSVVFG